MGDRSSCAGLRRDTQRLPPPVLVRLLHGGAIPCVIQRAHREYHLFPDLYDRVTAMAGRQPDTAIGDKGLSVSSCFEHTTERHGPCLPFARERRARAPRLREVW